MLSGIRDGGFGNLGRSAAEEGTDTSLADEHIAFTTLADCSLENVIVGVLLGGQRFTVDSGLVNNQGKTRAGVQLTISRDNIAQFDMDDIAFDELFGGDIEPISITLDMSNLIQNQDFG